MDRENTTGGRRGRSATRGGSVWETRMRLDQVKGGIKVFSEENALEEELDEEGLRIYDLRQSRKQSEGEKRKRKNWNSVEESKELMDNSKKSEEREVEERRSFEDKEIDQICDGSVRVLGEKREEVSIENIDKEEAGESEIKDGFQDAIPEAQSSIHRIVDLVMWREVPRSALVFGIGSFLLFSFSYSQNLNFSMISALSYIGLVYLAKIFFFNSVLRSKACEKEDQRRVFGEEEAIQFIRPLLPFANEMIINLRALFSGDPATTMKLAAVLFFMARCGCAITGSTMAKMAFFGVFTIPKLCSSYSVQLAQFGKFWVERTKDAWVSCQHKKAMAAIVFALFWNFSSIVSRIWAVFMLMAAVRLYQQHEAKGYNREEEGVVLRS